MNNAYSFAVISVEYRQKRTRVVALRRTFDLTCGNPVSIRHPLRRHMASSGILPRHSHVADPSAANAAASGWATGFLVLALPANAQNALSPQTTAYATPTWPHLLEGARMRIVRIGRGTGCLAVLPRRPRPCLSARCARRATHSPMSRPIRLIPTPSTGMSGPMIWPCRDSSEDAS